jgi:hypothetical protein
LDKSTTLISYGGVAEWLKAPVSKAGNEVNSFGGSNPFPSASFQIYNQILD